MEKLILDTQSKPQIIAYRDENRLTHYEPAILNEILVAAENGDLELLRWFNRFGDCFRSIIVNVHAYRKGLEFGFNEIAFDDYGWFRRPVYLDREELVFGNPLKYDEHSIIHIGRGPSFVWTYALHYTYGTAGGGSALSVYGKQFRNRDEAVNAGMAELKNMMTGKLGHEDTTNYKQAVITATLKDITKAEVNRVQLSLF